MVNNSTVIDFAAGVVRKRNTIVSNRCRLIEIGLLLDLVEDAEGSRPQPTMCQHPSSRALFARTPRRRYCKPDRNNHMPAPSIPLWQNWYVNFYK